VLCETLWCIVGYLAGIALCLTVISLRYGFFEYIDAIVRLMNMPSEASAYTPMSMIMSQIRTYLQNLRWLSYPAMLAAFGTLLFTCLPKWLRKIFYLPYVGIVFLLFWYLARRNMYNFNYLSLASMLQWAFFLLTLLILIGIRTLFHKKENSSVKLMVLLALLLVFLTPIGTNNHLIASINNLYFVAPFLLWLYIRAFGPLPASFGRWSLFPIKSMLACIFVMIFIQVGLCGWIYVFQEATGGENLHTRVENNDILSGMLTTPDRVEVIGSLTSYVTQENLKGKEVILYGMIPALSYYLEMPFAMSPWPDLQSYNYEVMVQDLDAIEKAHESEEGAEYPLVLLEKSYAAFARGGEQAVEQLGLDEAAFTQDRKFALLLTWLETKQYEVLFENEKFALYGSTE
jgi:hypothetical protein